MTTKEEFNGWVKRGYKQGSKWMIVVCDTFNYEDYPVFCRDDKEKDLKINEYRNKDMQKIMEVVEIKTRKDIIKDLNESL